MGQDKKLTIQRVPREDSLQGPSIQYVTLQKEGTTRGVRNHSAREMRIEENSSTLPPSPSHTHKEKLQKSEYCMLSDSCNSDNVRSKKGGETKWDLNHC